MSSVLMCIYGLATDVANGLKCGDEFYSLYICSIDRTNLVDLENSAGRVFESRLIADIGKNSNL